jgi:acetyl esterase/lipase
MARDRSGPSICFQALNIPVTDDRLVTWSSRRFTDVPMFNRPGAENMWLSYLGPGYESRETSPYAAPNRAPDLSGLPPAYIQTMDLDPLRDEGIDYAKRLMAAGVSVELHAYPGTFHGSGMAAQAAVSQRSAKELTDALSAALNGAVRP